MRREYVKRRKWILNGQMTTKEVQPGALQVPVTVVGQVMCGPGFDT